MWAVKVVKVAEKKIKFLKRKGFKKDKLSLYTIRLMNRFENNEGDDFKRPLELFIQNLLILFLFC